MLSLLNGYNDRGLMAKTRHGSLSALPRGCLRAPLMADSGVAEDDGPDAHKDSRLRHEHRGKPRTSVDMKMTWAIRRLSFFLSKIEAIAKPGMK